MVESPLPGCSPASAAARATGREPVAFPEETALGALARYISRSDPNNYQPTNIAFGLLPDLGDRIRDKMKRRMALSQRALARLAAFQASMDEVPTLPAASAG